MDIPTVPGALYTVATKTSCDITDTATGTPIDSASAGSVTFTAQGTSTTLSDPDATYARVNFKTAAAALRMLGGGDKLPAGTLAADFLESTAQQYMLTGAVPDSSTRFLFPYRILSSATGSTWLFANADADRTETNKAFKYSRGVSVYVEFGAQTRNVQKPFVLGVKETIDLSIKGIYLNGELVSTLNKVSFNGSTELTIPRNLRDTVSNDVEFFACQIWQNDDLVRDFFPCVSPTGRAAMWDKVSKTFFYSSANGEFAVGFTLEQARQLGKLPAGGGTLKISLPENYTDDHSVVEALSVATSKNWILDIKTYSTTAASSSSTFALRRIWVRKTADPSGEYVDGNGNRWHVEWCQTVLGAEPSDLGYEPFRSVEIAVEYWGLSPFIYPDHELQNI